MRRFIFCLVVLANQGWAENGDHNGGGGRSPSATGPVRILNSNDPSCPKGFPLAPGGTLPPGAVYVGADKARYVIPISAELLQKGDLLVTSQRENNEPYAAAVGGHGHTQLVSQPGSPPKTICTRGKNLPLEGTREVIRLREENDDPSASTIFSAMGGNSDWKKNRERALKAVDRWVDAINHSNSSLTFTTSTRIPLELESQIHGVCNGNQACPAGGLCVNTYCSRAATLPYQSQIEAGRLPELPIGAAAINAFDEFWKNVDEKKGRAGATLESVLAGEIEALIVASTDMLNGGGRAHLREFKEANGGAEWRRALSLFSSVASLPMGRTTIVEQFMRSFKEHLAISPADLVTGARAKSGAFYHVGTLVSPQCSSVGANSVASAPVRPPAEATPTSAAASTGQAPERLSEVTAAEERVTPVSSLGLPNRAMRALEGTTQFKFHRSEGGTSEYFPYTSDIARGVLKVTDAAGRVKYHEYRGDPRTSVTFSDFAAEPRPSSSSSEVASGGGTDSQSALARPAVATFVRREGGTSSYHPYDSSRPNRGVLKTTDRFGRVSYGEYDGDPRNTVTVTPLPESNRRPTFAAISPAADRPATPQISRARQAISRSAYIEMPQTGGGRSRYFPYSSSNPSLGVLESVDRQGRKVFYEYSGDPHTGTTIVPLVGGI